MSTLLCSLNITSDNIYSSEFKIDNKFKLVISGTWNGIVTLQQKYTPDWYDVDNFTSNVNKKYNGNGIYRFIVKSGNYTSGTITCGLYLVNENDNDADFNDIIDSGKLGLDELTGALQLGDASAVWSVPGSMSVSGVVSTGVMASKTQPWVDITHSDYGVKGDGTTDDTTAIEAVLTASAGETVFFPNRTYLIDDLGMVSNSKIKGPATFLLAPTALIGLNFSNVSDIEMEDITVLLSAAEQTGMKFSDAAQRINVYNQRITSQNRTDIFADSIGVDVANAYNIGFWGMNVDHVANHVKLQAAANRISFDGHNLRGSDHVNQSYLVYQTGGYGNSFSNGDIEITTGAVNSRTLIKVSGGNLLIQGGWMEGGPKSTAEYAANGYGVEHTGGILTVKDVQLQTVFFGLSSSNRFMMNNVIFSDTESSSTNPYIRYIADTGGKLVLGPENHMADADGVLYRVKQFYTAATDTWSSRTSSTEQIIDSNSVYRDDTSETTRTMVLGNYKYGGVRAIGVYEDPLSTLDVLGSFGARWIFKTGVASFTPDEKYVSYLVNVSEGNVTVNLPDAATCKGRIYAFKVYKTSGAFSMILTPDGSQKIDAASGITATTAQHSYIIQSNGANWYVLASHTP